MIIEERLKRSIACKQDDVFIRAEFARFGSEAQITRAIRNLVNEKVLVKLGVGVYAKAKPSILTGNPIPIRPVEVLAPAALKKLGVTVRPGRVAREYNSRASTQLPAGVVLNTGGRRVSRKIGFAGTFVEYERTTR